MTTTILKKKTAHDHQERAMDNIDIERERGITELLKAKGIPSL